MRFLGGHFCFSRALFFRLHRHHKHLASITFLPQGACGPLMTRAHNLLPSDGSLDRRTFSNHSYAWNQGSCHVLCLTQLPSLCKPWHCSRCATIAMQGIFGPCSAFDSTSRRTKPGGALGSVSKALVQRRGKPRLTDFRRSKSEHPLHFIGQIH